MASSQRLSAITLTIRPQDGNALTHHQANSLGPYMQGVLMEHVDDEYAGWLHKQTFNPYSQYCLLGTDGKTMDWHINTLTEEAFRRLIIPIQQVGEFEIHSAGLSFKVDSLSISSASQEELTNLIYGAQERRIKVEFVTPTAFKQAGSYVFMPDVRLMFQNLLMKYYQTYEGSNEVEEETLRYLEQHIRITSYRLWSRYFEHVSGKTKIPGFVGTLTLGMHGPQQICGLANMLLRFGEYAGMGIKTSMGMGGMRCL